MPVSDLFDVAKGGFTSLKGEVDYQSRAAIEQLRRELAQSAAEAAWPVGSIYIGVTSTNPATLLGVGTWTAFAAGRMLIGLNSGDGDFDTAEETGGAKTHTLTEANLAAHDHSIDHDHAVATTSNNSNSHTHIVEYNLVTNLSTGGSTNVRSVVTNGGGGSTDLTSRVQSANHTHDVTLPNFTGDSGSAGSGTAVTHMNPYIVTYMWKRTA
jgi:microcystin-dependent protein